MRTWSVCALILKLACVSFRRCISVIDHRLIAYIMFCRDVTGFDLCFFVGRGRGEREQQLCANWPDCYGESSLIFWESRERGSEKVERGRDALQSIPKADKDSASRDDSHSQFCSFDQ
jgi:hypothetical protein